MALLLEGLVGREPILTSGDWRPVRRDASAQLKKARMARVPSLASILVVSREFEHRVILDRMKAHRAQLATERRHDNWRTKSLRGATPFPAPSVR